MKLDHIAINVKNIETSVLWYIEELGATILYKDESWAMLGVGDTKIALTISSQHPPHFAFSVNTEEDIPSEEIKKHRDGSRYVYKQDPDGNCIEWVCY